MEVQRTEQRISTQIGQANLTSALKRLLHRSDRTDQRMSKKYDILDEIFRLMQQQTQAKADGTPAAQTEEYKKRAERLRELLSRLPAKRPR